MKTVVITGSTRGLGYALAKRFLQCQCQVVIHGTDSAKVAACCQQLKKEVPGSFVWGYACDLKKNKAIEELWNYAITHCCIVDIWINNSGVSQPDKNIWELSPREIDQMTEVDLRSTIYGSQIAVNGMSKQGSGAIYNVEGVGINDAFRSKLGIYGATKRAITCFSDSLTKEMREKDTGIIIGKLAPGVILTDYRNSRSNMSYRTEPSPKAKKAYNIYGDYPEKIAKYMVFHILTNTRNGARISWLTNGRVVRKFLLSMIRKRDLFARSNVCC